MTNKNMITWKCSCHRKCTNARVIEIGALLVPWNFMEFHGTARVIEIGALQVPWNSMELLIEIGALEVPFNSMELLVSSKKNISEYCFGCWIDD